jgi:hypothetical protein
VRVADFQDFLRRLAESGTLNKKWAATGREVRPDPDSDPGAHEGANPSHLSGGAAASTSPCRSRHLQPGSDTLSPADRPGAVRWRPVRGAAPGEGRRAGPAAAGEPKGRCGPGDAGPAVQGQGTKSPPVLRRGACRGTRAVFARRADPLPADWNASATCEWM